ncbi:hypothetical protein NGA_0439900, partial [Nannochloropsis gaditana CCMP526]|uniref:uncharacterized protein n=1 Tax=Nannochloropsis gaditana (strain CCMP526) TaxID=1093141 RepID=UPI00029F5DB3
RRPRLGEGRVVGLPHSPSPQPVPEHDRPVPVLGGHVESLSGFWTPAVAPP